jgi:hypothetical protein
MLEGIMAAVAVHTPPRSRTVSRADEQMSIARTCYDHVAGHLGVATETFNPGTAGAGAILPVAQYRNIYASDA